MKNLVLSIFPVLVFWVFEEYFGSFWGIVAAVIWSFGELSYEWLKYKKFQKLTLFASGSCIIFGIIGIWMDSTELFRLQPAILEVVFAFVFIWMMKGDRPVFFDMFAEKLPVQIRENPEQYVIWVTKMKKLSYRMVAVMFVHAIGLAYFGVYGSTGQWVFMKGPGLLVLFAIWFILEYFLVLLKRPKA